MIEELLPASEQSESLRRELNVVELNAEDLLNLIASGEVDIDDWEVAGKLTWVLGRHLDLASVPHESLMHVFDLEFAEYRILLTNPTTPSSVLDLLQSHHDRKVLRQLARHPNLGFKTHAGLEHLNIDDKKLRVYLARSDAATTDSLESLSGNEEDAIKQAVAGNPNASEAILDSLLVGASAALRAAVASNPRVSIKVLRNLADDRAKSVRRAVAGNPKCPTEIRERLAVKFSELERALLGLDPKLTARATTTKPELLTAITQAPTVTLRRIVAGNPAVPGDALRDLVKDSDSKVRVEIAKNGATPLDAISSLCQDEVAEVAAHALVRLMLEEKPITISLVGRPDVENLAFDLRWRVGEKVAALDTWIASNGNEGNRARLAQFTTDPDLLDDLSTDRSALVRENVEANSNISLKLQQVMADRGDSDCILRSLLCSRANLFNIWTESAHERLREIADASPIGSVVSTSIDEGGSGELRDHRKQTIGIVAVRYVEDFRARVDVRYWLEENEVSQFCEYLTKAYIGWMQADETGFFGNFDSAPLSEIVCLAVGKYAFPTQLAVCERVWMIAMAVSDSDINRHDVYDSIIGRCKGHLALESVYGFMLDACHSQIAMASDVARTLKAQGKSTFMSDHRGYSELIACLKRAERFSEAADLVEGATAAGWLDAIEERRLWELSQTTN